MANELKEIINKNKQTAQDMRYRKPREVKNRVRDLSTGVRNAENSTNKKSTKNTTSTNDTVSSISQTTDLPKVDTTQRTIAKEKQTENTQTIVAHEQVTEEVKGLIRQSGSRTKMSKQEIHQFYLDIYKWQNVVDRLNDLGYDGISFNMEDIEYEEIIDFFWEIDEFLSVGANRFAEKRTDEYITHMENASSTEMRENITYAYEYDMDELRYLQEQSSTLQRR